MLSNEQLRTVYERVFAGGREHFFTFSTEDISREVLRELDWNGLRVLEVGCGTGETAALIASAGAQVLAVDYATSAVEEARRRHQAERLRYEAASFEQVTGEYDVIVAQEVIEHTDSPLEFLRTLKTRLVPGGQLIITCPSFLNLRGVVWMTLQLLLDVPMSLTDRHFISPEDMEKWADQLELQVTWRTFRYGQAHGPEMTVDLRKRLTNALRDAGLNNTRVELLLSWLEHARVHETDSNTNGAKALYRLTTTNHR